ncbi:hypothetical protein LINPERHAP2_LOCUS31491, partial [Linum perenne]
GQAAAGGLIRGSVGRISAAYGVCLGVCSITRAELGAAVQGRIWGWGSPGHGPPHSWV